MSPEHAQSQCPENNGYLTGPQGGVVVVLEGLVILTFHTEKLRLREMAKVAGLTSGSLTSVRTFRFTKRYFSPLKFYSSYKYITM